MLPAPQNPRGKQPVEQSLDQSRTEKMLAFFALELDPEALLERFANCIESLQMGRLDEHADLAGVRSQEPGQVLR